MFERFTDRARRVVVHAQEEAQLLNHPFIGTEHLLLGLIHEGDGIAAKALESLGISLEAVRDEVRDAIRPSPGDSLEAPPPFTPRAKKSLELALREALQMGHNYIGTEHILLGLVREADGVAAKSLEHLGAELSVVRDRVLQLLSGARSHARPISAGGVSGLVQRERPRYPTKVFSGPEARLSSDNLEFSVVGVLCFPEHTQVLWRLSGIPRAIAAMLHDRVVFDPGLQRDASRAYVIVLDDVATDYVPAGSTVETQPGGEWAGSSLFSPSAPTEASSLRVVWQGETLNVDLRGARS